MSLSPDDVEKVLFFLGCRSLARAACVCVAWYEAFRRIARVPQWLSSVSTAKDLKDGVAEACREAMGQMQMRPQIAFVFFSKEHVKKRRALQDLPKQLRAHLPPSIPVIGCSGEAIIAHGKNASPIEIHGRAAISVSLAYFGGNADVETFAIEDMDSSNSDRVPALPPDSQCIVLGSPHQGIGTILEHLGQKTQRLLVLGGLASGTSTPRLLGAMNQGPLAVISTGLVAAVITPRARNANAQQFDAVVAPAGRRAGTVYKIMRCRRVKVPHSPRCASVIQGLVALDGGDASALIDELTEPENTAGLAILDAADGAGEQLRLLRNISAAEIHGRVADGLLVDRVVSAGLAVGVEVI
jgi:hypothetical protein